MAGLGRPLWRWERKPFNHSTTTCKAAVGVIRRMKQPADDSRSCPGHHSAASILTSETISTTVTHHAWQPAPSELVSSFEVLFDLAGREADRDGHFRAPLRH